MLKRLTMTLVCVASLSGCASFISSGTGSAPVGTSSGERSLGQVLLILQSSVLQISTYTKPGTIALSSRINIESFHSNVFVDWPGSRSLFKTVGRR